jgi:hypothetical protein
MPNMPAREPARLVLGPLVALYAAGPIQNRPKRFWGAYGRNLPL